VLTHQEFVFSTGISTVVEILGRKPNVWPFPHSKGDCREPATLTHSVRAEAFVDTLRERQLVLTVPLTAQCGGKQFGVSLTTRPMSRPLL
jgi:hypothetical protein